MAGVATGAVGVRFGVGAAVGVGAGTVDEFGLTMVGAAVVATGDGSAVAEGSMTVISGLEDPGSTGCVAIAPWPTGEFARSDAATTPTMARTAATPVRTSKRSGNRRSGIGGPDVGGRGLVLLARHDVPLWGRETRGFNHDPKAQVKWSSRRRVVEGGERD